MRISDWRSDVCSSDLAVIFEHGSVDAESMTSCGTAHAHLHIVPLSFELSAKAIGFDQGLQWEECSIVDVARRAAGREYLFMADRYASMASRGWLTVLKQGTSQRSEEHTSELQSLMRH